MKAMRRRRQWIIYILSAINGLLYAGLLFLTVEKYNDYRFQQHISEADPLSGSPGQVMGIHPEWPTVAFLLLILFVTATYLVRRCWSNRSNEILFWQGIGIVAVALWNVIAFVIVWLEKESPGQSFSYDMVVSLANPMFGPISLALVVGLNFLYALITKSIGRYQLD